jgi:nucleotide-binding universal stress UspA family protein
MFTNILVPLDFSEDSRCAVNVAADLARQHNAAITLIHVIETIDDADFVEIKDFYGKLEKRAMDVMDNIMAPLVESGLTVKQKIVFGNRAAQILQFAHERKIDLIVLSSHRINPAEPAKGWGTISHKVGLLSQCPVLLVK